MGPALILPEKNWGACVSSKHHYSGAPSLHCALETSTFSYPPVNCTSKQNKQTAEMSPLSQSGLLPILLLTSLVLHKVPFFFSHVGGIPGNSDGKESASNTGDPSSVNRSGGSPGEGNSYPLPCSHLENSMDRGAWRVQSIVSQGVGRD